MKEKHACCATVYDRSPLDFNGHPCGRGARYIECGKWYCKTHAPSEVKKRDDARDAKYDRERAIRAAGHSVMKAERRVLDAVNEWVARAMTYHTPVAAAHDELVYARAKLAELKKGKP